MENECWKVSKQTGNDETDRQGTVPKKWEGRKEDGKGGKEKRDEMASKTKRDKANMKGTQKNTEHSIHENTKGSLDVPFTMMASGEAYRRS